MARTHLLSCALLAGLCGGCVHAQDAAAPSGDEDKREVAVLRERVGRLERRLSDLDAQLSLLTEKVADPPRDSVSLGPSAGYEPAPTSYAPPPASSSSSSRTWNGYASPQASYDAGAGWQQDNGASRSIDLGPGPPRSYPPPELPEEEPGDEPSADASDVISDAAPAGPPRKDAQATYDWGLARMRDGRYLEAISAFEDLQRQHPQHALADNALYWTGSCHLERGEPRLAIDTWKSLPLRFPDSAKMADSLYGMALAHEELGEPVLAETLYGQLIQQYPKAEKVGEARKALKRLSGSPDAPR